MARVVAAVALLLIGLVLLIIIAPFLLIAAALFLLLAWKRPSAAERVTTHQRLAPVPAAVRATPVRFASVLVAGALLLTLVSAGFAGNGGSDSPEPAGSAVAMRTADEAMEPATTSRTPQPTPVRTPRPTLRPTPRATPIPTPTPTPTPQPTAVVGEEPTGPTEVATVASVTDGDTIRVLLNGENVPVRYIGIDSPETQNGLEWMGAEASAANAALVAGQEVILEKDVSETDQYGRLLRYVWVAGEGGLLLVNLELVRQGFAQVTTYPPDVKYADALYLPAERAAREAGVGLWGVAPTPVPTPVSVTPLVPQPPSNCEPSYPDICIPIGSADLDCGEIQWRRFTVLWNVANPDPHRFDGDADGIGCES